MPGLLTTLLVVAAMMIGPTLGGPAVHAQDGGSVDPTGPTEAPATAQTPEMSELLDDILALAPADTCFTLTVGGSTVYHHNGDRDLIPASTQKLVTAAAALEVLGPDHTYSTRAVASTAPVGGVLDGDLHLVGGGDPLLVTDVYRLITDMSDDQAPSRFEDLADQIVASGITRITGSVLGDEGRYDSQRSVATWPQRYITQRQSGPLSALTVDDGYRIELPAPDSDRSPVWHRSEDPAATTARMLHDHLRIRGVEIAGEPTSGPSRSADVEIAALESAALPEILGQLLMESDNQTGELILKELGHAAGSAGSTAAGVNAVTDSLDSMGLSTDDLTIADGSGLDRDNQISCDDLVTILDSSGGPQGIIGQALPVAGVSGTLERRFTDSSLSGRLLAKTGRLSDVTALAGFTPMADDEMATFAYISNGEDVTADLMELQTHLLTVVSLFHPPCLGGGPAPVSVPVGPLAGQVALLGAAGGPAMVAPAAVLPLPLVAEHPAMSVAACGGEILVPRFEMVSTGPAGS